MEGFVSRQGRMKYIRPLFRILFASSIANAAETAKTLFLKLREKYHPIADKMVGKVEPQCRNLTR
jgi:hypothetical protein